MGNYGPFKVTKNGYEQIHDILSIDSCSCSGMVNYHTISLEELLDKHRNPTEEHDAINHPKHYTQGSIETIDIIFNVIEPIENPNVAMCIGNSVKYLSRFTHKGKPVEDLKKAIWYINKAIEEMEE